MSEFVNTVDTVGDEALAASIIDKTITEIADSFTTTIGKFAFQSCSNLTTANFPAVTCINDNAFRGCSNLTAINFPNLTSLGAYSFYGCSNLTAINFPNLTSLGGYNFCDCDSLTAINFPSIKGLSTNAFYACRGLSVVDLPAVTYMGHSIFYGCTKMTALIIRTIDKVPSVYGKETFASSAIASGTCYIYVPKALVDSYKAAQYWSTYANQFRALEDYTVDGTTTGELDSSKI